MRHHRDRVHRGKKKTSCPARHGSARCIGRRRLSFDIPLAFLIFNRPEETERCFAAVRALKPTKLFLIADGPRSSRPKEADLCRKTRDVVENIDWPCEVFRNYSGENLGCKRRVSSGISWVFQNVEEAVFLEDDCLPDPTFFEYCREMLRRYASDPRVMSISGTNFQFGNTPIPQSYYFSRFNHVWGWASWRRAWNLYDPDIQKWPAFRDAGFLRGFIRRRSTLAFFRHVFDSLHAHRIDTWDGQWTFAHFANRGACIIPAVNLVSNVGFGIQGTHTKNKMSRYADMPVTPMPLPLTHPETSAFYPAADDYTEKTLYSPRIPIWFKEFVMRFIG